MIKRTHFPSGIVSQAQTQTTTLGGIDRHPIFVLKCKLTVNGVFLKQQNLSFKLGTIEKRTLSLMHRAVSCQATKEALVLTRVNAIAH